MGHLRAPVSPARSQSKPNASNGGIPLDRDAMMRQLRHYEEKDDANYQLSRAQMREKQNEQRREGMERRMMGGEDYMGTPEGERRLKVSFTTFDLVSWANKHGRLFKESVMT